MIKKKATSFPYLFGSVLLILSAIIATTILGSIKSSPEDIRARAGNGAGIRFTAVVSSVDETNGTVTVTNVVFAGVDVSIFGAQGVPQAALKGDWVVTTSGEANLGMLSQGTKVEVFADPGTIDIAKHTLTAKKIKSLAS